MYAKITEKSCEAFKLLFLRTTDFTVTMNVALTKKEVFSQLRSNGFIPLLFRTKKGKAFPEWHRPESGLIFFFQKKKKEQGILLSARTNEKEEADGFLAALRKFLKDTRIHTTRRRHMFESWHKSGGRWLWNTKVSSLLYEIAMLIKLINNLWNALQLKEFHTITCYSNFHHCSFFKEIW